MISRETAGIISASVGGASVSLGHDWLTGMRGGERVLEFFCKAFPDAPIATLINVPGAVSKTISGHRICTSFLNMVPGIGKTYGNFLPLMPLAADTLRVPESDVLITTSHCIAKSFRKSNGAKHICVCFTPMRYAWLFYEEYFGKSKLKAAVVKPLLAALRRWDRATSARVDRFVAISRHVAKRINKFYGRECDVVYPAVDTERCTPGPSAASGKYDLIVSALVPYKRVDLAVSLYSKTGWPLKVVGAGRCARELIASAGPSVEFLGRISDDDVLELYRGCRFLLFPGEEDYGIVPLEAQACGKPVVAYGRGGALETVVDGETGVFFEEQTVDCLENALNRCAKIGFDAAVIRKHAENFGSRQFAEGVSNSISATLGQRHL